MATLIDSLLARIGSAFAGPDVIPVYSGDPGIESYPFVVVNALNWEAPRLNTKLAYEQAENIQVTAAALDPLEAATIGAAVLAVMMPARPGGNARLVMDDGYEIVRIPGPGRRYHQTGVGPDGMTVFYYQFDFAVYVGKRR